MTSPHDLVGMSAHDTAALLYPADSGYDKTWSLTRESATAFRWTDHRLGTNWRATHGQLVALSEVTTKDDASSFAAMNKIHFLDGNGLFASGVAEIFLRCSRMGPDTVALPSPNIYSVVTQRGMEASVGYCSYLFRRLVSGPLSEANARAPDPAAISTVVLRNVNKEDVPEAAELALFHLRREMQGVGFSYGRLADVHLLPDLEDSDDSTTPPSYVDELRDAERYETIAFINRAYESESISAFLYLYRALEACFDTVLHAEVSAWRGDTTLDSTEILRRVRNLSRREDVTALRKVLAKLVDQSTLDELLEKGVLPRADVDTLTQHLYERRNSIAHGRLGQHNRLLVPYAVGFGGKADRQAEWLQLMQRLVEKALDVWLLRS